MLEGALALIAFGLFIAYQVQRSRLETLRARIWAAQQQQDLHPQTIAVLRDLSRPL